MNKEEKIQAGTSRAEKDWETIQTWEMWKNVTRAEARYATTVKGFSNIENDAYTKRMIELVSSKL